MSKYVKLPFESLETAALDPNWNVVCEALLELKGKVLCYLNEGLEEAEKSHGDPLKWMRNCICKYNREADKNCNFLILEEDPHLVGSVGALLPAIIDHAMGLPNILRLPIHVLSQKKTVRYHLQRNLICSLLANGFLCTFPKQSVDHQLPDFNFWRLFHKCTHSTGRNPAKTEKLRCIMEYFKKMGTGKTLPNTFITFERRFREASPPWSTFNMGLSELNTLAGRRIEDCKGALQVDFANSMVGGGVLDKGSVQEEIRFITFPELLAARLFTERLDAKEVLVVTGARQFSDYTGYSGSFKFKKLENWRDSLPVDNLNREVVQVVAMDALAFEPKSLLNQYNETEIHRELHKCHVAFFPRGNPSTKIATGNWGCGVYNGDPELKFLIQWMAASVHGRPVIFHAKDETQRSSLENIRELLSSKLVTVAQLYQLLLKYKESFETAPDGWFFVRKTKLYSLFEYIHFSLNT